MQPELILKKDEIEKIKNDAEELLHEIISSNIDKDLKQCLVDHIEEIKNAIEEYELEGIVPLRKAFESTVGSISIQPKIYQKLKNTKHKEKFWTILAHVALILSIAVGTIQIGKDTIALLTAPETNVEESQHKETKQDVKDKSKGSKDITIQV